MDFTPSTLIGYITVIGFMVCGVIGIWGLVDKQLRDRRKDGLEAADSVIDTLNKKIDLFEERIVELENERKVHTTQIAELKATNDMLTKLLQGRDGATTDFQHKVLEAVVKAEETNKIVKSMELSVEKMAISLTRFIDVLEKRKV